MPYYIMQLKFLTNFFLSRYQIGLETSMGGSDFISDSDQLLHYKSIIKPGGSCIDSPD